MSLRERQRQKLLDSAARHASEDEQMRFVVAGQTGARPGVLASLMALTGKVKPRVVVGTDQAVYLLEGSMTSTTKSGELIARFPSAEAVIDYDDARSVLRLGDEEIWLGSYTDSDIEALSALAGR